MPHCRPGRLKVTLKGGGFQLSESKERPFEELRRALAQIDLTGDYDEETDRDRSVTRALRLLNEGEPESVDLRDEAIDIIADSAKSVSLSSTRVDRLLGNFRERTSLDKSAAAIRLIPAVMFRQEGPSNPEEHEQAIKELERIRSLLDGKEGNKK